MTDKVRHIVGAKGNGEPTAETENESVLYRTVSWQVCESPDDPDVLAIFALTPNGTVGLEFPKKEALVLASTLNAAASSRTGRKQ